MPGSSLRRHLAVKCLLSLLLSWPFPVGADGGDVASGDPAHISPRLKAFLVAELGYGILTRPEQVRYGALAVESGNTRIVDEIEIPLDPSTNVSPRLGAGLWFPAPVSWLGRRLRLSLDAAYLRETTEINEVNASGVGSGRFIIQPIIGGSPVNNTRTTGAFASGAVNNYEYRDTYFLSEANLNVAGEIDRGRLTFRPLFGTYFMLIDQRTHINTDEVGDAVPAATFNYSRLTMRTRSQFYGINLGVETEWRPGWLRGLTLQASAGVTPYWMRADMKASQELNASPVAATTTHWQVNDIKYKVGIRANLGLAGAYRVLSWLTVGIYSDLQWWSALPVAKLPNQVDSGALSIGTDAALGARAGARLRLSY